MYPKEILINNQKINNEQIISNDHGSIEFIFENTEIFCTSYTIQLIASGILNSINSIPRNKNATIIINGERLTSNSSMILAEVKIGNYPCSIITLSPKNITCYMAHRISENNLPVTVNIDGITNQNKLYFNYDSTLISSYSISNVYYSNIGKWIKWHYAKLYNSSYDIENKEDPNYQYIQILYHISQHLIIKPSIESCYIKDEFIICTGEFNNYGFYNNTFITFSNQSEPYFTSDLITIGCCGIISDPYELTIKPTIKGAISKPFDNNGSIVIIDGENFNSKQNVSLECGSYKFGCTYLNHSSFSCDAKCPIEDYFCPHVEQCIATSMDQSISFNITFNGPKIDKVGTIRNYIKDHWVLALSGFNFYPLKTSLLIDGEKRCTVSYKYIYLNNTKSEEESSTVNWKTIVISLVTIIFVPPAFIYTLIFFLIPERFFKYIKRERIIEDVNNNHSSKGDEYLQTREVYNKQRRIFLDMFDNIIMAEDISRIPNNNNLRKRNSKNKNNNNNNNDLACSSINNNNCNSNSNSNSNNKIDTISDVACSSNNNKINNNNNR
ncbi:hypothetical protein ACTFIR_011810 [Dictyostelium discoideum]